MRYLYLVVAILSEVCGTTFLKQSDGFSKLVPSLVVVVSYAVTFYCMSLSLKSLPTGIVYATWSGVGIVLIALAARLFQGQRLDPAALVGMGLIVAGVIVMNAFSASGPHQDP
ncbi:quaternary ammonium compound resistance protein [Ameyamaea chiangmaiensis NBRC 103196]|uniref:Multidrug efflux SMR transporter n=1 Tax=Ameyamaea chiangmaiensis TaxID=442969 RepID=A0A850PGZ1_9PROT|nr:multidrug efflux SMR transporter [Ameyamaea chiangmaiensis]MBS4074834.1 multidrug efflux SMR transporter [Ameyamaea chiangmaiensis]NVN41919.1 multidrug efflux SMR transporter [Ameyamaea chiangmaiensis]GBQ62898.1 quaternary ammonium compound resistance protein [Ameyamaea chiangmaiensis NBRC 103196]